MASIDQRIASHEIEKRKLWDRKDILEKELIAINEKIIYHWSTIQNLNKKKCGVI